MMSTTIMDDDSAVDDEVLVVTDWRDEYHTQVG